MQPVSGEYPYDPSERFSAYELERAVELRQSQDERRRGSSEIFDRCPHTPACPTVAVCLEEIAWYLRHKSELDA